MHGYTLAIAHLKTHNHTNIYIQTSRNMCLYLNICVCIPFSVRFNLTMLIDITFSKCKHIHLKSEMSPNWYTAF